MLTPCSPSLVTRFRLTEPSWRQRTAGPFAPPPQSPTGDYAFAGTLWWRTVQALQSVGATHVVLDATGLAMLHMRSPNRWATTRTKAHSTRVVE